MRVAILTVSDAGARGERLDTSGDAIAAWAASKGYIVAERAVLADDEDPVSDRLADWADADKADVILTTGGTGLAPRDVTPEATRVVTERDAPGIAERIRVLSVQSFPRAALSRGVAGTRKRTLIINLPGSTSGVTDGLAALDAILDHAVAVLRADRFEHGVDEHASDEP